MRLEDADDYITIDESQEAMRQEDIEEYITIDKSHEANQLRLRADQTK